MLRSALSLIDLRNSEINFRLFYVLKVIAFIINIPESIVLKKSLGYLYPIEGYFCLGFNGAPL